MCSLSWCSLVTYLSATRQTSHPTTYAFWKHFCSSRMVGYEIRLFFLLMFLVCNFFSLKFFSRKFFTNIFSSANFFLENFFIENFSIKIFYKNFLQNFFFKFFLQIFSSEFFLRNNFILSNTKIIFSPVFYIYIWYQVYLFSRQLDLDGRTSLEGILQITTTNP